jgi:hypothetical protein
MSYPGQGDRWIDTTYGTEMDWMDWAICVGAGLVIGLITSAAIMGVAILLKLVS